LEILRKAIESVKLIVLGLYSLIQNIKNPNLCFLNPPFIFLNQHHRYTSSFWLWITLLFTKWGRYLENIIEDFNKPIIEGLKEY